MKPSAILKVSGQEVLIDEEDLIELSKYKWYIAHGYAVRWVIGTRCQMALHRQVIDIPRQGAIEVDHIDGNKLNNTKTNLRLATPSQNRWNAGKRKDNTSGFKGVYAKRKKWTAEINANNIKRRLGVYQSIEEAAKAYDRAAMELHGSFARLNFKGQK